MDNEATVSTRHLIAAFLLDQGTPDAATRFFASVYEALLSADTLTCTEMAHLYGCTPQAASKHLRVLTTSQFLRRVHYRAWEINLGKINRFLEGNKDERCTSEVLRRR
jgi:predicted ArsR family transcriptional regulator